MNDSRGEKAASQGHNSLAQLCVPWMVIIMIFGYNSVQQPVLAQLCPHQCIAECELQQLI